MLIKVSEKQQHDVYVPLVPLRAHKPGAWLPADRRVHRAYVDRMAAHADANPTTKLSPALQELKTLIESEARVQMYFVQMFDEIPLKKAYLRDPTGASRQIRDYHHLLQVLNQIVSKAPEWTNAAQSVGLVGVPMNAILDYPMGTASGHAAFLDPEVNRAIKKVLNEWGKYLQTPASKYVLGCGDLDWFGPSAQDEIMRVANAPYESSMRFEDMYVCDPSAPHYGFKSWDDFFTRRVHDSARPVASPDDDSVVANACESKVYNIEYGVKLRDRFYAKGQPYSVIDMLAGDPLAAHFANGTIYQAFLSAVSYHRWHSPVSGVVRRAFVQDGTYFSEPLFEGVGDRDVSVISRDGLSESQGYLSALATRAIIVFEADNPRLGLVAFIGIGMDEVSTCEITVREGQRVRKGDTIGMFHYGGSSHCLLFQDGVRLEGFPDMAREANVPVRGKLVQVR